MPPAPPSLRSYDAYIVRVVDADTIQLDVNLGFSVWLKNQPARLYGVNMPEKSDTERSNAAIAALKLLLSPDSPWVGAAVVSVRGVIDRNGVERRDKYGRLLVELFNKRGENVAQELLKQGHGVPYFGECYE
jgi:micrococcal nuclease